MANETALNKKRGELAELKFMVKAGEYDIIVSKPFGDSCEYDFITDVDGKLNRVQVKSIWTRSTVRDRYMTKAGKGKHKDIYDRVDLIAVYVNKHNVWYLIPNGDLKGKNICLYPHRKSNGIYEEFREAWNLLG